jgi:hypothetical protein
MWIDGPVSINVYLIAIITGLETDGEKLEQYLDDKTKEKTLAKENTWNGERVTGIIINRINEPVTRLEMKLMA